MNATFVGGPWDGRRLDHHDVRTLTRRLTETSGASGSLVVVPSPDEGERLLAGRLAAADVVAWYAYGRFFLPGGHLELRYVGPFPPPAPLVP